MTIRIGHPVVVDTQYSLMVLGKYFDEMCGHLRDIANINYWGLPIISPLERTKRFMKQQ